MRTDPKEIYGWRVYMLACSVGSSLRLWIVSLTDTFTGLFRRDVVRHGLRHHRRGSDNASIPSVCAPLLHAWCHSNSILPTRKYGLQHLDKVGEANLSANIVSTLQAGCFFGALIASPAADKWGRRMSLLGAAMTGIVGVVMQTAASGYLEAMYIGR